MKLTEKYKVVDKASAKVFVDSWGSIIALKLTNRIRKLGKIHSASDVSIMEWSELETEINDYRQLRYIIATYNL